MDNLKIQGETPMNEIILCKLGEVVLKGLNRRSL